MDRFFEDVRINRAALGALPIYVGDIDMHDMVEHQEASVAIWRIHAAHILRRFRGERYRVQVQDVPDVPNDG